jgi:hypothetical protein
MDHLIEDIRQQTSTLKRSPDTEPLHAFFHYLPIFEKSRLAGLKVFYTRKTKGAAQRHPMVSLLLDMERLGTIRSDFLLIENNLSITFYVQRPAVKKTLEAHGDEIRSSLQGVFAHLNLKFVVSEKKIESFRTTNPSTAGDGKLDVMA